MHYAVTLTLVQKRFAAVVQLTDLPPFTTGPGVDDQIQNLKIKANVETLSCSN